jgi:hypothetical protein
MKTVWIYVNTDTLPGDVDHLQVFASEEAAQRWLDEHDPEGAAFEYPVQE